MTDLDGNPGLGEMSIIWTLDTIAPEMTLDTSLAGDMTNGPLDRIRVEFSEPIMAATFDRSTLTLTLEDPLPGENLITPDVRIEYLEDNLYAIAGLRELTGEDGHYTLTVDGAMIRDLAGNAGSATAVGWNVDTIPPDPATNLGLSPETDTGVSSTDGVTTLLNVTIVGDLPEADTPVELVDTTTATDLGEVDVTAASFSHPVVFAAAGIHRIRARVFDAAGNHADSFFDVFVDHASPRVVDVQASTDLIGGFSDKIDILFSEPMTLQPSIDDGSIVAAVTLVGLIDGDIPLTEERFSYDADTNTLSISLLGFAGTYSAGYYELHLDGSQMLDRVGNALRGGSGGVVVFDFPNFDLPQNVQAAGADIQVDNYSVPSLADWNSDGLLDLVVGEKTDADDGKVGIFLNVGTVANPVFDTPFYVTAGGSEVISPGSGCLGAFPRVFDWDQDGRKDLVVGQADGKVQVLLNTNTDDDPQFNAATFLQVGLPGSKSDIDVGDRATLDIVDFNNDGRYDLVLGALDGRVRVYLNEAASGAADLRSELVVADGPADLIVPSGRSSVAVYDLNADGRKDLVLGNTEGQMLFYANTGSDAQPAFDGSQPLRADGEIINLPGTPRSRPFVGDFNGDQIADLLIGSADGLVRLYTGRPEAAAGQQEEIVDGEPGGEFVHTFYVATSEIRPGVTLSPTAGLWTTEDHGTAQFTVALDSMPEGTVTIGLSSDDTDEGTVAPSELTFTADNWYLPQTVTVTGQDDPLLEGDVAYTILTAAATGTDPHYLGFDADNVTLSNRDNEVGLIGRHIFYNNSHFDGYTTGPSEDDDGAVAPDPGGSSDPHAGKTALLPGQQTTLQNYTNYSRGINGIMIDIVNVPATPDASDFVFMVGNSGDGDTFSAAPLPLSITVRPRAGVAGADRVTLIWQDNVIENEWLQVTVRATEHTGLIEDDIFYFGNAPGEAGDHAINTIVNATDEIVARNFQHSAVDPALIDDPYDYNRDGLVNGTDQIIARNNQTNSLSMLGLITAPAADAVLEGATEQDLQDPEALSADLDWLYEFERMNTRRQTNTKDRSIEATVDTLLATDWS